MPELDEIRLAIVDCLSELYSFVTEVIAKVPGLSRTTTLIVPLVLKDVYQWRIPRSILANKGREQSEDRRRPTAYHGGNEA